MIWEGIQGLGAVVGLLTGTFVIWERITKHRPVAYFVAIPFVHGEEKFVSLRVSNPSLRPLFIRVRNGTVGGAMRLAEDDSIRSIVKSIVEGESTFVVDGSSSQDFPVLKPPDFERMDLQNEMVLYLHWRFAQPIVWREWRRIRVGLSKHSFVTLTKEWSEGSND